MNSKLNDKFVSQHKQIKNYIKKSQRIFSKDNIVDIEPFIMWSALIVGLILPFLFHIIYSLPGVGGTFNELLVVCSTIIFPPVALSIISYRYFSQVLDTGIWLLFLYLPIVSIIGQIVGSFGVNPLDTNYALIVSILIPFLLLIATFYGSPTLREHFLEFKKNIIIMAAIWFVAIIIIIALYFSMQAIYIASGWWVNPENQTNLQSLIRDGDAYGIIVLFFSTIIISPFIEEICYRFGIFNTLNNEWFAIFVSTIFFASLHMHVPSDWIMLPMYMPMALISAVSYYFTRNITISINLHMAYNLLMFILMLVL